MPQTYVAFAGIQPVAATPTVLYTAPGATTSLVGWLSACNVSTGDDSIRIWRVPSGQSTGAPLAKYAINWDMVVDAFDPYSRTEGITLATGDSIVVQSTNGNVAFGGSALELS